MGLRIGVLRPVGEEYLVGTIAAHVAGVTGARQEPHSGAEGLGGARRDPRADRRLPRDRGPRAGGDPRGRLDGVRDHPGAPAAPARIGRGSAASTRKGMRGCADGPVRGCWANHGRAAALGLSVGLCCRIRRRADVSDRRERHRQRVGGQHHRRPHRFLGRVRDSTSTLEQHPSGAGASAREMEPVSAPIAGLQASTTYHYRLCARDAQEGPVRGAVPTAPSPLGRPAAARRICSARSAGPGTRSPRMTSSS